MPPTGLFTVSPWLTCYQPRPAAKVRLFCFPHGGGGPQVYRDWSDLLPASVEVYSLSLPGRGSRLQEPLITSMDELVAAIAGAIQDALDKPFAFFGHSVGALVCFEVARRLYSQGSPLPIRIFVSAHTAPHLVGEGDMMHRLPDDELVEIIRNLGLVPEYALENEELIDFMLPPLKADFAVSETYRYRDGAPLPIPISAYGGTSDDIVSEEALRAWERHTSAEFEARIFGGGHFYTQTHMKELLQVIYDTVQNDFEALPLSVLEGPHEEYPADKCLHELFRQQARITPDATAVVDIHRRLTFRELDERTDVLARFLRARGVGVDKIVGIYMESCVEYVVAYLGILKAGGAYMPIETEYPLELLERVLESAQPVVVLTKSGLIDRMPGSWKSAGRVFAMDDGWEDVLASESLPVLDEDRRAPTSDSLAYCVMTSGTTGEPKGIICPHRGSVNSYTWRYRHYPYEEGEREACNIFFVWEVIRPILQGYPSYVIPDDVIYDPPRLVEFLSENKITRVLFTPSLLEQILNTPDLDLPGKLSHLRIVYLNGEVVPIGLRNRFYELFPNVKLLNDYSISECHDVCTYDLEAVDERISPKYAPLGPPMANVRVYVLDDDLRPVPKGMLGEVYVGGDSLARGYLNEPGKTAERFIPDPLRRDGSIIFRTGDLGRILPNDHLEVVGRVQFMVKLRGYSIVLGAVETALAEHPAVKTAVVLTEDNEVTGQPEYLVAYVVSDRSTPAAELEKELRSHLKKKLPHYAVPSYFVQIDKLPLHEVTGKLDRRKLPKAKDVVARTGRTPALKPPRSDLEKTIAGIWSEVLKVEVGDVTENFFDLGGHSLLAIRMCTKLSKKLGVRVSVIDVFQHPTVELLTGHLSGKIETGREKRADLERPVEIKTLPTRTSSDVAVIGFACRFPGAPDAETFWRNLRDGIRTIREFTEEELAERGVPADLYLDENYVRAGAVLEDVDKFDPAFWNISRKEAAFMDPQHRLFLECCWEALERAGYAPLHSGARTGVFAGCYIPSYLLHCLQGGGFMDPGDPSLFHLTEIGNDKDYLPTRVSYLLNLRGPSISVQTSCSTSAVAVATAYHSLVAGQCDMALAGASSITFPQAGYLYVEGHVSSKDGHVRAFDANASGTVLGDGVGVVVLKRLEDALAAGDDIWAVIKGAAVNNDGSAKAGYSAPSVQGQAEVIAEALMRAAVSAETISFVEGHGTGTLIGDPIEVRAITEVFRRYTDRRNYCALGSVKANIGHSNIAAGMAGLIKTILALRHRQIPPMVDFQTPNPEMQIEKSPFYINTELLYWDAPPDRPRRAGVSCFGIGGTNCHIILEEAPPGDERPKTGRQQQVLTLSAKSAASLERSRRNLIGYLQSNPAADIGDVAYTLHVGREHFPYRLAVSCRDGASAAAALANSPICEPKDLSGFGLRTVFMFPGQGSQYLQMGYGLYRTEPKFKEHFDRCCELLEPLLKLDLRSMAFASKELEGAEERFTRPRVLQPSLFSVEYALAKTLMEWGIIPDALAGHSIGEYVAATLAGLVDLRDALSLIVTRSLAIEEAGPGAMLSVHVSEKEAAEILAAHPDLVLAVVNSPKDVVFAGSEAAVEKARMVLEKDGVICRRVQVDRAFHAPMMHGAAEKLARKAQEISYHPIEIRFASNLYGGWMPEEFDPAYWSEHLKKTVRFADNVRTILAERPRLIIEVGPGRTLSTLISRFDTAGVAGSAAPVVLSTLPHPLDKEKTDSAFFSETLAKIWALGEDIDWKAYHASDNHKRVSLPAYSFERERVWWDGGEKRERLPGKSAPPAESQERLPFEDRFYIPSWARSLPPLGDGPALQSEEMVSGGSWAVFLDSSGTSGKLGEILCHRLANGGAGVLRIYRGKLPSHANPDDSFAVNPKDGEEVRLIVEKLYSEDPKPQRILYLWTLEDGNGFDGSQPVEPYYHFLYVIQAVIAQHSLDPILLWIVTTKTLQVGQEETLPVKSTVLGPCFAYPQEYPQVSCRLLDIEIREDGGDLQAVAGRILAECTTARPDQEPVVALRGKNRWVQRYEPVRLPARPHEANRIRPGGVYIITGGLGRIGMLLAEHLSRSRCRIVLTDIVDFPKKSDWRGLVDGSDTDARVIKTIQKVWELEKSGAEVFIERVDVTDRREVERLLEQVFDRFGAIDGIFHAAGLAHLKYLPELTDDISELEFKPKVYGLLNLERAIREVGQRQGRRPEFVVLFSSLASILGGYGMAAYTAANRFMDAFVQADSTREGVSWVCINWDDWSFAYTKEQTAAYDKTSARFAIPPEEGLQALERILSHAGVSQVLVATRPMEPRVEQWLYQKDGMRPADEAGEPLAEETVPAAGEIEPEAADAKRVEALPAAVSGDPVERRVAEVYQQVLGIQKILLDDNFFDLGGDSLLAAQILLRLQRTIPEAKTLMLKNIFDYPTVCKLAEYIKRS